MDTEKKIIFLSNELCRKDAFEGNAHQNIADQIAKIIGKDIDRHIIGIEGGWGAGKSNLISLVNIKLNGDTVYEKGFNHKNSPYPFFIYDAWGHQSDFQRRAILEELTNDLTNEKKILDEKKWERKLQELLAKRKKTSTKEVPKLGVGLIASIVMAIITPLVTFVVGLIPEGRWCIRVLTALLPYFIVVLIAICNRRKSLIRNGQDCTWSNILYELFLVYKDQIKENETYTTISEKEPSSSEFKKWMDEVDSDLGKFNKTLIIVFDNMDRLPSHIVESLWSSIHSFFSDKTYNNIKVLIPFDRCHVQQAFKNEDIKDECFGNDFINKTFDVVFRVPPPIMRGWQQYMSDMWKKAFGDDAELSISVIQIYDALSKNHTPRKIIAFINEMAAVKMTMRDEIPDRYIALFIFGKEHIDKNPIAQLLEPDYMGDVKFEYEKDPDTIKYISALYYQLPVEKALDVVFTREATDALNSGNAERLHEIMEHIELSAILGNAILKVTSIEKASYTLAALDQYYGYKSYQEIPEWLKKIWGDLYQRCKNDEVKWNVIKPFHMELFAHLHDVQLADNIINGYLSIEDSEWDARLYVESIDKLRVNNDIIDKKLNKYKRKIAPKVFIELLRYTKKNYEKYGVLFDLQELDNYLASLEQNDVMSLNVIPNIILSEKEEFSKYKAKLKEWIGNSSTMEASGLGILFMRLKEVSEKPITFNDVFNDIRITNAWNALKGSDNPFKYDLLAMRIARGNAFSSAYVNTFQEVLNSNSSGDIEGVSKVIEYYLNYGTLTTNSTYYKDYTLVVKVHEYLTKNKVGISKATILDCLYHFDETVVDYGISQTLLFERLDGWSKFVKAGEINIEKLPSGLLEVVKDSELETAKIIRTACDEYYTSLSQEQWKEHILNEDNTFGIWKEYHPKRYQENFDALKSVLKEYANGTESTQPEKSLMTEWLEVCIEVKHSVKALFNEISSILKKDSAITKAKLLFFGAWILEYTEPERQKDFVEKLIPSEIIDSDVVSFIASHIDRLKECVIPEDFKEKIKHLAETSMKGEESIGIICDTYGIVIEEPESAENSGK